MNNLIFNDIISTDPIKSSIEYHQFIKDQKKFLFGHLDNKEIKKNSYLYDASVSPQKYIYTFFQIISYYEKYNKEHSEEKSIKLFSVLPLRSSLIPCYITLDSEILISNFKKILKPQLKQFQNVANYESLRRKFKSENNQYILWKLLFNMNSKAFKFTKNYKFCYMLKTDGIGASIMFIEKNQFGKSKFQKGIKNIKNQVSNKEKKERTREKKKELYIEKAVQNKNFNKNKKNIVCIDPNKRDLIYSGMYKNNKFISFRYTQNQRRVETKRKKYSKYLDEISKIPLYVNKKNEEKIKELKEKKEKKEKEKIKKRKNKEKEEKETLEEIKIKTKKENQKTNKSNRQIKREKKEILKAPKEFNNDLMKNKNNIGEIKTSIKELETLKSYDNKRSIDIEKIKIIAKENNEINKMLLESYKMKIYRKLRLNIKINTQKSESNMIKNFSKKMGSKNETMIIIGDYNSGSYNMKGLEPAICKKIRTIFGNAGYECYLIDEYNTSKLCNECEEELSKFLKRKSSNPKKSNEEELVSGILRCQSSTHKSEIYHNRDKNAVKNMLKITETLISTKERPKKYKRNCEI
jgi:hypothetical protein